MKNKEYFSEKRKRNREVIELIKNVNKCSLCGESRSYVLDFHHIDATTKKFTIATASTNTYSVECIISEMKKCSCLCANCHREYHFLNSEVELLPVNIPSSVLLIVEDNKQKNIGTGGFIGVSYKETRNKYYVSINRKTFKTFKYFKEGLDAAKYYDKVIVDLDGPEAITNIKMGLYMEDC